MDLGLETGALLAVALADRDAFHELGVVLSAQRQFPRDPHGHRDLNRLLDRHWGASTNRAVADGDVGDVRGEALDGSAAEAHLRGELAGRAASPAAHRPHRRPAPLLRLGWLRRLPSDFFSPLDFALPLDAWSPLDGPRRSASAAVAFLATGARAARPCLIALPHSATASRACSPAPFSRRLLDLLRLPAIAPRPKAYAFFDALLAVSLTCFTLVATLETRLPILSARSAASLTLPASFWVSPLNPLRLGSRWSSSSSASGRCAWEGRSRAPSAYGSRAA